MTGSTCHCPVDEHEFWLARAETNPYMTGEAQLRQKLVGLLSRTDRTTWDQNGNRFCLGCSKKREECTCLEDLTNFFKSTIKAPDWNTLMEQFIKLHPEAKSLSRTQLRKAVVIFVNTNQIPSSHNPYSNVCGYCGCITDYCGCAIRLLGLLSERFTETKRTVGRPRKNVREIDYRNEQMTIVARTSLESLLPQVLSWIETFDRPQSDKKQRASAQQYLRRIIALRENELPSDTICEIRRITREPYPVDAGAETENSNIMMKIP